MNNQKAHTEADKEREREGGGQFIGKCRHLRLTNNKRVIISYLNTFLLLVFLFKTQGRACNLDVRQRKRGKSHKRFLSFLLEFVLVPL